MANFRETPDFPRIGLALSGNREEDAEVKLQLSLIVIPNSLLFEFYVLDTSKKGLFDLTTPLEHNDFHINSYWTSRATSKVT